MKLYRGTGGVSLASKAQSHSFCFRWSIEWKLVRYVWSRGKAGGNFQRLPSANDR